MSERASRLLDAVRGDALVVSRVHQGDMLGAVLRRQVVGGSRFEACVIRGERVTHTWERTWTSTDALAWVMRAIKD